jgi:hypothetical protein
VGFQTDNWMPKLIWRERNNNNFVGEFFLAGTKNWRPNKN